MAYAQLAHDRCRGEVVEDVVEAGPVMSPSGLGGPDVDSAEAIIGGASSVDDEGVAGTAQRYGTDELVVVPGGGHVVHDCERWTGRATRIHPRSIRSTGSGSV